MRFSGHRIFSRLAALQLGILVLVIGGSCTAVFGQTAPYVLPYTISTYAGGNAQFSGAGATCGSGNAVALDTAGDGCLALQGSINGDPHDVRVDARGYLYFIDDSGTSSGVIHRVNPFTQLMTIYVGSLTGNKACTPNSTKYGDGCPANDGVANDNTATPTTLDLKAIRGIGIAPNGNLYIAGYNDYYDHVVLNATGYMQLVAGTGATGDVDGPVGTSKVDQSRGIGTDPTGTITYIADSANNILRQVYNGVTSTITEANPAAAKNVISGQSAINEQLLGPEDSQTDSYGNIYIANQGDGVVMAIYKGGTLPGISNPTVNNIYLIAGSTTAAVSGYSYSAPTTDTSPTYTYPADGTTPTVPATSVSIGVRKLALDRYNNLYIADSTWDVVWFVDHATGYMRLLAGRYYSTAVAPPATPAYPAPGLPAIGCGNGSSIGDGCAGTLASVEVDATANNTDLAVSPDTQGNLYITDSENGANSRIRKLLSGLNFPATPTASTVTQTIQIHFAPGDAPTAATPYTLTGTGTDFTLGTASCATQADTTTDCLIPVTFTPAQAGYDTASLTITSAKGGTNTYELTGEGTAAAIAFDPGNTTLLGLTIGNAQGIATDSAGDAYIADSGNNRVLFYNAKTAATTVFAGGATAVCGTATDSFGDGCAATSAKLNAPAAVAIDTTGSLYIADTGNNIIRKVNTATGTITLYAGGASASTAGGGCAGLTASVTSPVASAYDALGDGCPALQANFSKPAGLATDNLGSLYVADTGNNVIRQIASNGFVFPFAGGASSVCSASTDALGDGCGANAVTFKSPTGLAFDNVNKALLVADTGDSDVRRISLGTTYTVAANVATGIVIQPVTKIAGNDQPGTTINAAGTGVGSELNSPTGVAADAAGNVYIADTGNSSIRLVNAATNAISTIAGITSAPGSAAVAASATLTQLTSPAAVAVLPNGTLYILDSGNNRVIADARSQIAYSFGRTNVGSSSPVVNITELNIGTNAIGAIPAFVQSPTNSQFTLAGAANSSGSIPACAPGALAAGAICNLQGQFTPTSASNGVLTVNETQTITPALPTGVPTITLTGTGAVLTQTTSTVMQTSPALPTSSQYGSSVTLTGSVTPTSCNTAAPACYPSGTIAFLVDGTALGAVPVTGSGTSTTQPLPATATQIVTGLSVGTHTISCNYSGDDYYAASTCMAGTITVVDANTTAALTATNNNQVQYDNCFINNTVNPIVEQCGTTVLTVSVASTTVGTPDGSVSFYNGATLLGASKLINGSASITLAQLIAAPGGVVNGTETSDTTLPAGTYQLTCKYAGSGNYSGAMCPNFAFTVLAPTPAILSIVTRGCPLVNLYPTGTQVPNEAQACVNGPDQVYSGNIEVSVAQGSTTDASLFILPTDNLTGTLTFSCSGLPADSTCTFSPTSIPLIASSTYVAPLAEDVTLWTDLQPGSVPGVGRLTAPALGHGRSGIVLAEMIGWPLMLLGFAGILKLRRKAKLRGLVLLAIVSLMTGSALTLSGCSGPGDYKAVLTPAGIYPITITVSNGTVKSTTLVYFNVTSPGIPGQEVRPAAPGGE